MLAKEGQRLNEKFFEDLITLIQTPMVKTFNNIDTIEEKHRCAYLVQTTSNDMTLAPNLPIGFFTIIYNISNSYINIFNLCILPPKYTTLIIITDTGPISINSININPFNIISSVIDNQNITALDNGKCFNLKEKVLVTLPTVINNGFHVYIKNSSNEICSITSNGSIQIENQSILSLLPKNSIHLIFDGTNYISLEGKTTKNLRILNNQSDASNFKDNDFLLVTAPMTITLPIIQGLSIYVRRNFSSAGLITITTEDTNSLIDGSQSVELDQNLDTVGLICDGINYFSYTGNINGL